MIIDGTKIAEVITQEVKRQVQKEKRPFGLGVILVGSNPESEKYVQKKQEKCLELGVEFFLLHSRHPSEDEITTQIKKWNDNPRITGIIVQLPLPNYLDKEKIIASINPVKDVDGLTNENMGRLIKGLPGGHISATALAVMKILAAINLNLEGKEVVVLGRSNLVTKPLVQLLVRENATVTICHSKTKELKQITRRADILITGIGQAEVVKADMIGRGTIIIDVGTKRYKGKITGDVDFTAVAEKASFITPVPGGVGPVTVAMLLRNVVDTRDYS